MSRQSRLECLRTIHSHYARVSRHEKQRILDEFCRVAGSHRKYTIRLLNEPPPSGRARIRRHRRRAYPPLLDTVLEKMWAAAGYRWSVRLKPLQR